MNAADVVGYAYEGDIYCTDHCPVEDDDNPECSPIFADNDGWEEHCCGTCHWPLDDNREVYGIWIMEQRVELCMSCWSPMCRNIPEEKQGYDIWPIMKGWNGDNICDACGGPVIPPPDEEEEEEE